MNSPESPITSPEKQTTEELKSASRDFYGLIGEVEDALADEEVDPANISVAKYWMKVAEAGKRKSNEEHTSPETMQQGRLLELTAMAPIGFLAQIELNKMEHPSYTPDPDKKDRLVALESHYNGLMADYARGNDNITAHELNNHITKTVRSGFDEMPDQVVRRVVSRTIRGVQHEVAGGDLLFAATEARVSSDEEDLQGADYVMELDNGEGAMVDIKSSYATLMKNGAAKGEDFTVKNGRIIINSMLSDEDLNGRFHAPEETIAKKAPHFADTLDRALELSNYKGGLRRVKY